MKKYILLFAIILINACFVTAQSKSFKFGAIKRKYIVYLPKTYNAKRTYPLVYNFHGGGMTAAEQMFYSRMNQTADKHNFIVVYPTGVNADWNVGFEMSYLKGTDDIGFIKALTDTLKKKYKVNDKAVFAAGLSRGGFFCHRLAAEMPGVFAAIASVGGPLPDSVKFYNHSSTKIAVLQVSGTEDKIVDYNGKIDAYSSAIATFNYWITHNNLSKVPQINKKFDLDKNDGTLVLQKEVSDKTSSVMLLSVIHGGHTWPGSDSFNIGYPLGKTTKEIDINELMWAFFYKNKKP